MGIANKFRELTAKALETTGTPIELPKNHPSNSVQKTRVLEVITKGYKPVSGVMLIGATDEELAETLKDLSHNAVRWARWSMTKDGYVKDSGNTRNRLSGSGVGKVWVVGDGVPQVSIKKSDIKQRLFNELSLTFLYCEQDQWAERLAEIAVEFKVKFDPVNFKQELETLDGHS